jgi:hypothetical protein
MIWIRATHVKIVKHSFSSALTLRICKGVSRYTLRTDSPAHLSYRTRRTQSSLFPNRKKRRYQAYCTIATKGLVIAYANIGAIRLAPHTPTIVNSDPVQRCDLSCGCGPWHRPVNSRVTGRTGATWLVELAEGKEVRATEVAPTKDLLHLLFARTPENAAKKAK